MLGSWIRRPVIAVFTVNGLRRVISLYSPLTFQSPAFACRCAARGCQSEVAAVEPAFQVPVALSRRRWSRSRFK